MNSVYGYVGATKGMLPCVPIAASVTATGRRMIEQTSQLAQTLVPGSQIVYGDSVASYTPVIVRVDKGPATVRTIDSLGAGWTVRTGCDKEMCTECQGMEVWSDGGWTSISSIIRHRTTKPMVRVSTPTGLVDCTTDHSLVLEDGTPVGPLDVVCGTTKLLHAACTASSLSFPRTGIVYRKSKTQLECAFDFLLATASGSDAVVSFHSGMYYVTEVAPDESIDDPTTIRTVTPISYSPDDYVYDLTTANHHFAAGPGRLVVHNTDSVMVILNLGEDKRQDMHAHFAKAQWLADEVSKTFPKPVELEFEKVSAAS